jgi:hypothetical protein
LVPILFPLNPCETIGPYGAHEHIGAAPVTPGSCEEQMEIIPC